MASSEGRQHRAMGRGLTVDPEAWAQLPSLSLRASAGNG